MSLASPSVAYSITAPPGLAEAVVFDSPHSGMECPSDFGAVAPHAAILTTWDAFVDELLGKVLVSGATLLSARFPRAYIDANRAVDDIDPALLDAPWPGALATSDYSRRGMGLIRRFAVPGVPLYDRLLTVAEVGRRINLYYEPYRAALRERLDTLYETHGFVWHVNCHSMKSRGNGMNTDNGALRPDFVISDRLGRTAEPAFASWAADWFAGRGFSVKINDPYRGGDLVGTHGDPARGRHSIQLEINRALYMDEEAFTHGPRFGEIQEELSLFARSLVERARQRADGTMAL